ncbi:uncharacterized protein LOC134471415 [Cavia porcellus]|uniref:uncharacterized protein LOC134471415 n=1 Tax=Cavia porcellus TaxID=10141 RepID=UPI002FE07704
MSPHFCALGKGQKRPRVCDWGQVGRPWVKRDTQQCSVWIKGAMLLRDSRADLCPSPMSTLLTSRPGNSPVKSPLHATAGKHSRDREGTGAWDPCGLLEGPGLEATKAGLRPRPDLPSAAFIWNSIPLPHSPRGHLLWDGKGPETQRAMIQPGFLFQQQSPRPVQLGSKGQRSPSWGQLCCLCRCRHLPALQPGDPSSADHDAPQSHRLQLLPRPPSPLGGRILSPWLSRSSLCGSVARAPLLVRTERESKAGGFSEAPPPAHRLTTPAAHSHHERPNLAALECSLVAQPSAGPGLENSSPLRSCCLGQPSGVLWKPRRALGSQHAHHIRKSAYLEASW